MPCARWPAFGVPEARHFVAGGTRAISKTGRRSRSAQRRIPPVRERTAATTEITLKDGRYTAGSTNHPFQTSRPIAHALVFVESLSWSWLAYLGYDRL